MSSVVKENKLQHFRLPKMIEQIRTNPVRNSVVMGDVFGTVDFERNSMGKTEAIRLCETYKKLDKPSNVYSFSCKYQGSR